LPGAGLFGFHFDVVANLVGGHGRTPSPPS
jgi:hypothetical protein